MARHGSANVREETSPRGKTSNLNKVSPSKKPKGIDAALKRRARLLISNSSIPRQTRSLIQYTLEIKDPYLDQVVRRVEAGEMTIEHIQLD